MSQGLRGQWSNANNASLLELCIAQRIAGAYNGAQMSADGYQSIVDGLLARKRLVYSKQQVRNQIGVLKTPTLSGDTCKCTQGLEGIQMDPLMQSLTFG